MLKIKIIFVLVPHHPKDGLSQGIKRSTWIFLLRIRLYMLIVRVSNPKDGILLGNIDAKSLGYTLKYASGLLKVVSLP